MATILQVGYLETLLETRARMLELSGFRVVSVLGNAALFAMTDAELKEVDLIILGHCTSLRTRTAAAKHLKARVPEKCIVALRSSAFGDDVPGAEFNVDCEKPEHWLQALDKVLATEPCAPNSSASL